MARSTQQAVVTAFQRRVLNPLTRRVARWLPNHAVLETRGRRSGLPRRTPVGGRLDGNVFWVVSEFGRESNYVRNIAAEPRVRVQLRGTWHPGFAHLLDDDDPRVRLRRLPWLNSLMVRLVGRDLLTVRIDVLDIPSESRICGFALNSIDEIRKRRQQN